jgi:hypothetical protein
MTRQDAMFYVNEPNFEIVAKYNRYEVVRNGYMRINNTITDDIYRYTSDLEKAGYNDDKHLAHAINTGELEVIDNPWFEVWNSDDLSPDSQVFDTHRQACKEAWELAKQEIEDYVR